MSRHVLRPAIPVKPLVIAAVLSIIGAGTAVLGGSYGASWAIWLGIAELVAGVGVLALALLAWRRGDVTVDLTDEGYRVEMPDGSVSSGDWEDVRKVDRIGDRLVFHHDAERRTVLAGRGIGVLERDLATHLDASRGYGA